MPKSQEESARSSISKTIVFGTAYALIIIVVIMAAGEFAVRLLSRIFDTYRSAPFRSYDEQFGVSLIPNVAVMHNRGCFRGEVVVNRWGMRDRERTLAKPPGTRRIALIGDSIVEGVHVQPDEVINIRMEDLLSGAGHPKVEVLNFGIGGIGTTQQLLLYTERVRHFNPDLVLLLFSDNDVMNNSSSIQPKAYGLHGIYAPYYDLEADGRLVFRPVARRPFNRLRIFVESRSLLAYYVARIWSRANVSKHTWHGIPIYWGVYGDPPDREWKRAWKITELVLSDFRDAVVKDGSRFMVVAWPSFFEIDKNWRHRLEDEIGTIPSALSPRSYSERLESIAARLEIAFDVIAPFMRRYRDEHALAWPYFSLECDPHPSPLGHRVGAEAIVERLTSHALLGDAPRGPEHASTSATSNEPAAKRVE